jgi:hypothetical protein
LLAFPLFLLTGFPSNQWEEQMGELCGKWMARAKANALGHIEGKYALARTYLDNPPAQLAIWGDRAALPAFQSAAPELTASVAHLRS